MRIQLNNKFVLTSDSNGWTVLEIKTIVTGKNAGTTEERTAFYAGSLAGCLGPLPDYVLRTSEVLTLKDAIEEIRTLGRDIEVQIAALLGSPERFQAAQDALAALPAPKPTQSTGDGEIVAPGAAEED